MQENIENAVNSADQIDSSQIETKAIEPQETLYNKEQVSAIVKREQQKAFERGKRDVMQHAQEDFQVGNTQDSSSNNLSEEDIRRMIEEKTPEVLKQQVENFQRQQFVDSFVNKMKSAEERYPGLEDKLNELDFTHLSPLIQMANGMDNTADIMHELVENPMKIGNIMTLMYTQPKMAQKAMYDLSDSIKRNQEALKDINSVREPLKQLKSNVKNNIDSNVHNLSVSDFRKIFR